MHTHLHTNTSTSNYSGTSEQGTPSDRSFCPYRPYLRGSLIRGSTVLYTTIMLLVSSHFSRASSYSSTHLLTASSSWFLRCSCTCLVSLRSLSVRWVARTSSFWNACTHHQWKSPFSYGSRQGINLEELNNRALCKLSFHFQ